MNKIAYAVRFGPDCIIKTATQAAKYLRDTLKINKRLERGNSQYEAGYIIYRESSLYGEGLWQSNSIFGSWLLRDYEIVLVGDDKDIVGRID